MSTTPDDNGGRTSTPVLFVDQLDDEIERRRRELDALLHARSVLRGVHTRHHRTAPNGSSKPAVQTPAADGIPTTVSEGVEQLLQMAPHHEMHLDDILKELDLRFRIRVSRKNLANTLGRWLARGKKFDRVATNTYSLR